MYSEVGCVLVSSQTQIELQIMVEPDYLLDHFFFQTVFYYYAFIYELDKWNLIGLMDGTGTYNYNTRNGISFSVCKNVLLT